MKQRNYVAKYATTYNKAHVQRDRKKQQKLGYDHKHKQRSQDGRFFVGLL